MERKIHLSPTSPISLRWLGAIGLLTAEALWLTATFSAPETSSTSALDALLGVFREGYHRTAFILFAGVFILVSSAHAKRTLSVLSRQKGYRWWPAATLHCIALLAFAGLTWFGFGTTTGPPHISWTWFVAWIAAAAAAFGTWLLIIAPAKAWIRALRVLWLNLVIAFVGTAAIWVGGLLLQSLWKPLAAGTLRLSALLLSFVYPATSFDPSTGLLGSDLFMVEVGYPCSGYEGIALVSVFVGVYLWIFRNVLPFPRAFLLFPIGIFSIWLANVLRVTALILIGTSISPEVAARGFHSNAGWIAFSLVSLGLIASSHRWLTEPEGGSSTGTSRRGSELALLLPLTALMATTMVTAAAASGFDALYPLGVVVTGAVLWHYRAAYRPLFGPLNWEPFAIGAGVFVLWVLLVPGSSDEGAVLAGRLFDWPAWLAAGWILLRVLGSVITVPLAEELAFRDYVIRKLVAKDFETVRRGRFTWLSFILSSLLFGLLHSNLLAGTLAGAAYAIALYRRGYVGDAILAHVTSNALIAGAVLAAGQWALWA